MLRNDFSAAGSSPRVRGKPLVALPADDASGLIPACAGKTFKSRRPALPSWAHPRVCGENSWTGSRLISSPGSSPRVRGKHCPRRGPSRPGGLIPACAGKTVAAGKALYDLGAHPRVCGENNVAGFGSDLDWGSSPRVRGKQAVQALGGEPGGLIPACAGKTSPCRGGCARTRAHPRVCGENPEGGSHVRERAGSSPRVRGKPRGRLPCSRTRRLIPACAGKTSRGAGPRRGRSAHPRVCGENWSQLIEYGLSAGSSPRVRGKPSGRSPGWRPPRLIPACAGKTLEDVPDDRCPGAHPRVCGENGLAYGTPVLRLGSSPRVRGKHRAGLPHRLPRGLIPACAGKTPRRAPTSTSSRAHPRVCGENLGVIHAPGRARGSSPRVRGKRGFMGAGAAAARLIPACAGKTGARGSGRSPGRAHPRVCGEN